MFDSWNDVYVCYVYMCVYVQKKIRKISETIISSEVSIFLKYTLIIIQLQIEYIDILDYNYINI